MEGWCIMYKCKSIFFSGLTAYFFIFLTVFLSGAEAATDAWLTYLQDNAVDLETEDDLAELVDYASNARIVLLGESTHGTVEYYQWRKRISRKLISEHGFDFILVEGDWPSFWNVNSYVKGLQQAPANSRAALAAFQRWPQWMWANPVIEELIEWLAKHNSELDQENRVGFYGMDVYAIMDSIDAVIEYLDADKAEQARQAYAGLLQYRDDPHDYVRAIAGGQPSSAEQVEAVVEKLRDLEPDKQECADSYSQWFNAMTNALAVRNGERHYRAMLEPGSENWNRRVEHMKETLNRLLDYYGEDSKAIVWAHNTHIGDARATAMAEQGMVNIGQLSRQRYGRQQVAAVGFAKYTGRVRAGSQWGMPGQVMDVPEAMEGSFGQIFRQLERDMWYVIFDNSEISGPLLRPMGHRAIGVTYNPANERGNYVPTVMPRRYDAVIYIEDTTALDGLDTD